MPTHLNSLQNLSCLITQMSKMPTILSEILNLKTQNNTSLLLSIKKNKTYEVTNNITWRQLSEHYAKINAIFISMCAQFLITKFSAKLNNQ